MFYRNSRSVPPAEALRESALRLHHRGPDATGEYRAPGVAFAHTRLSFLDTDPRSNQPLWDESGRYCIVFNGEIYNFRALRSDLEARQIRFRTTSDTEVLLHALIHGKAEEVLRSLSGMFGLAFYDSTSGDLLLARDRFGMKPLYLYEDSDLLMFSSEIRAMRPWVTPGLDDFSISSYLLGFGGPTKGFTFYRNLRMVAPGDFVRWKPGAQSETRSYFQLPTFWDPARRIELASLSDRAVVDLVDEQLSESVRSHMFADVPVGAFCSGGVDSSIIAAMATRSTSNLALFHADMKGRWSEHAAAKALAKHLKRDLISVEVNDADIVRLMPEVMSHYEHPFSYHPNCAPLMMVAELARESGVKGLLSGEGSDECFLGYPWLGRQRLVDRWFRTLRQAQRLLSRIPGFGRVLFPIASSAPETVKSLMNRREIEDDRALVRATLRGASTSTLADQEFWSLDYLGHHLRTLLHRNDTMGMAASIEARFPFLDNDLVRTAVNLPFKHKLRLSPTTFEKAHPFVRDKWIVRMIADRYMPRSLSRRIKVGFWTTAFERMKVQAAYFDESFTRDLFSLTTRQMRSVLESADQDLAMRLLHLDIWGRTCVEERSHDSTRERIQAHISVRPD